MSGSAGRKGVSGRGDSAAKAGSGSGSAVRGSGKGVFAGATSFITAWGFSAMGTPSPPQKGCGGGFCKENSFSRLSRIRRERFSVFSERCRIPSMVSAFGLLLGGSCGFSAVETGVGAGASCTGGACCTAGASGTADACCTVGVCCTTVVSCAAGDASEAVF